MRCTSFSSFESLARRGFTLIPVAARIFSDHLTPVLAYRRFVAPDDRNAPSFLLESVEGGAHQGRFSFLGSRPDLEITSRPGEGVLVADHRAGGSAPSADLPGGVMGAVRSISAGWKPARPEQADLPATFVGGWVGYCGYDTARAVEPESLPTARAPRDDRNLAEAHLALYRSVAVFDTVTKTVHIVAWVALGEHTSVQAAHAAGVAIVERMAAMLQMDSVVLPPGSVNLAPGMGGGSAALTSTMTRAEFEAMVRRAQEYIRAGDIFQVVLSQRFQRTSPADPFEVYRALRIVNPSPYMIYLQTGAAGEGAGGGCILVASSPEILCRVRSGQVVNRPLAGTRRRGATPEEDARLEEDLLADPKERAEHIMLVDLGRNDVGRVSAAGSVRLERSMEVERYSHVMHISSTVTGALAPGLDCFDALRAALPAGTVSGAPKIRAMQIIDELEPVQRGPYGGGIGCIGFSGDMDMALALRTMVIPSPATTEDKSAARPAWTYHLQAGAGVVLDSDPASEFQETVNKSAALAQAIDLAESAFVAQ